CGESLRIPSAITRAEAATLPPPSAAAAGEAATLGREETLPQSASSPAVVSVPGYEIEEELGRGGMGVIYKARQLRPRRLVALKMILSGEHAGPDALARFRSEAEAVARLNHPNVVQIFEVGEHQGRPFLCLEFVPGGNLA